MNIVAAHFEDAMVPRDFRVLQVEVAAFAADDETRLVSLWTAPLSGPETTVRTIAFVAGSWEVSSSSSNSVLTPPELARANDGNERWPS
jgi:hypothetical protein